MPTPDPSGAFAPVTLADDLSQLRAVFARFFAAVQPSDWDRPTERRPGGWTLRETLAHVTAVAEAFDDAFDTTLAGQPPVVPGLATRTDLAAYNRRQIDARLHLDPATLVQNLDDALGRTAARATSFTPNELALLVPIPAYNRPLTVLELLATQLSHAGVVHAAQLANGAGAAPLWAAYPPDLSRRQLTRFFNLLSHVYWPEHGGELRASINYTAAGAAGGRWHLTMSPDGGSGGEGHVGRPALRVWTPSAHTLLRIFTLQVGLKRAALTGQMVAWGNLRLGFRLPYLCLPT